MLTRRQPAHPQSAHPPAPKHPGYPDAHAARNLVLRGGSWGGARHSPGVNMWQSLALQLPATLAPGVTVAINVRNIGLLKRVLVRVVAKIHGGTTNTSTLTKLGLANFFSNVTFQDQGGLNRITTLCPHLVYLSSLKRRRVWGAAYTTDTPFGIGNNNLSTSTLGVGVQYAPASISANADNYIDFLLEIPVSVSDEDLRGTIYAGVTQAQMQYQLTFNPNMFVTSAADPTLAMYQSAGADLPTISQIGVTVYQNYLDQLPEHPNDKVPILPLADMEWAYMLNNTNSVLPVANSDLFLPFVNGRSYLSILSLYDNAGSLNPGTDINYYQIVSANLTPIVKVDPYTASLMIRDQLGADLPPGMQYFDLRRRPIDSDVYGNMQWGANPSNVGGSSATFLAFWEALTRIGRVAEMGSMPSA
jgi:hypothetical protein